MNRNLKLSLLFGALTILILAIFFYVLIILSGPTGAALLWQSLPAMLVGMIGGSFGALYATLRPPDERALDHLKDATRNSWIFLLFALPFTAVILIFIPTWTALQIAGIILLIWVLALAITYGSYLLYYYRK